MIRKVFSVVLFVALVFGVGTSVPAGPPETKPQARTGEQAQEKAVAKKYPPYPDVWGYELPWRDMDDREVRLDITKTDDGDYFVTYITAKKQVKRLDGSCCDVHFKYAGLSFFGNIRKDIEETEYDKFWQAHKRITFSDYREVNFKDDSMIRQESHDHPKCYVFAPYTLARYGKGGAYKTLLYLRDKPRKRKINPNCESVLGLGRDHIFEQVEPVYSRFVPLEDDTFLVYDFSGNFIIRFTKDLETKYPLNERIFLLDAEVVDKIRSESANIQIANDNLVAYLLKLKNQTTKGESSSTR